MKILGPISRGAFGVVERVELENGVVAALKTFNPLHESHHTEKVRRRFCREAQLQQNLGGLHVMPVLSHELDGDSPWYVMPLAEKTLAEHLAAHAVTDDSWPSTLIEVMDALEYIHSMEYFHRDLKPRNVLRHEGRWKLSDFGIALPAMSEMTQLSGSGSVWGSTMYMSPEQAADFHHVDARADVYALGCVLHDIFARGKIRVPHRQHTCEGPMGEIVARCTRIERNERYANVGEVRPDVLRAIREVTPPFDVEVADEAWLDRVRSGEWTTELAAAFAEYLQDDPHDRDALLDELRPKALQAIHGVSPDAWQDVARLFCKRAHGSFPFSYCDVVVQSLLAIYSLGGVAIRSLAIHAAAELGASHNRWHVMRQLDSMAGRGIEEALARRIVIDGKMSDSRIKARANLVRCAEGISTTPRLMYHPIVAAWLA